MKAAEASDVESGKLCYDLNAGAGTTVFYQTLGTDSHPVLDATHGYVILQDGQYVNSDKDAIETVYVHQTNEGVYTLSGIRVSNTQRGITIMRQSDGTVRKVILK